MGVILKKCNYKYGIGVSVGFGIDIIPQIKVKAIANAPIMVCSIDYSLKKIKNKGNLANKKLQNKKNYLPLQSQTKHDSVLQGLERWQSGRLRRS